MTYPEVRYLVDISWFEPWLLNGERGLSSEAIVEHLTGKPVGGRAYAAKFGQKDYPRDAGDFRRCEMLLRAVSPARAGFRHMADVSPEWAALVEIWDEVAREAERLDPGIFTNAPMYGTQTPISARISAAIRDARKPPDIWRGNHDRGGTLYRVRGRATEIPTHPRGDRRLA